MTEICLKQPTKPISADKLTESPAVLALLDSLGRKGITCVKPTLAIAVIEPTASLIRAAMIEALRHHVAARPLLNSVIADLSCGIQSLIDVADIEKPARLGIMSPYAGQTVGLKLEPNRQTVSVCFVDPSPNLVDLRQDPQEVLHVMAYFMRDHISLGKITGRVELGPKLPIEAEINIDLVVCGAVKRTGGGTGKATRRLRPIRKKNQNRLLIVDATVCKDTAPGVLGIGQHHRNETGAIVIDRVAGRPARCVETGTLPPPPPSRPKGLIPVNQAIARITRTAPMPRPPPARTRRLR